MTFYLCMMDTRIRPTSERGKIAAAKPCTTGVVFKTDRDAGKKCRVIPADETLISSLDLH